MQTLDASNSYVRLFSDKLPKSISPTRFRQLETADRQEPTDDLAIKAAPLKEKLAKLKEKMGKLEAHEKLMLASPDAHISLTDPDIRSIATSGFGSGVVQVAASCVTIR